ncbi:MAG: ribosome biogenesis GTP-binding protein YihA/YsxC [Parachlamydiaceae bacterium]
MNRSSFQNAKFVKTAIRSKDYPTLKTAFGDLMPEIAVAGRSNVGKSSLLNHLFHSKDLVKTSSTPGKTQAINFFTVSEEIAFADLPGYGYAQVPTSVRKQWGPMVQEYLEHRPSLRLILFLFDIRRTPNEEDLEFLEWTAHHQKSVILVLTKIDKVTRNEKAANTKKILAAFDSENLHHVHYSVVKNQGNRELMQILREALNSPEEEMEHPEDIDKVFF